MTSEPAGQDKPALTLHTCCPPGRGPAWGRKTPGCPRCDELLAGAPPRDVPARLRGLVRQREMDEQSDRARREHFAPGGPHARGDCGPVCTAFDY
jgi:hypothetical protein